MHHRITLFLALFLFTVSAKADLILMLDDGLGDLVTVADNSALDMSALDGAIVFVGAVGVFDLNMSSGLSAPALGTLLDPMLHLSSLNLSSEAGGSITISMTATGFLGPLGNTNFGLAFGGATGGSIDISYYIDTTNAAFGTETLLTGLTGSGGGFGFNDYGAVDTGNSPYSLSLFATITHAGKQASSFDAAATIPEPGTLALLGLCLVAMGFMTRRKNV